MPQKWVKTGQKRNTNALAEIAGWVKEKNLVEEFEFGVLSQLQMNNKEQGLVGKAWWGVSHPGTRCGRGQSSRTSGPVAGWKKVLSGKLVVGSWGGVQLDAGVDLAGIKKKNAKIRLGWDFSTYQWTQGFHSPVCCLVERGARLALPQGGVL